MEVQFLQLLAAGGDTAMLAVAYGLWRLEKRITVLELTARRH